MPPPRTSLIMAPRFVSKRWRIHITQLLHVDKKVVLSPQPMKLVMKHYLRLQQLSKMSIYSISKFINWKINLKTNRQKCQDWRRGPISSILPFLCLSTRLICGQKKVAPHGTTCISQLKMWLLARLPTLANVYITNHRDTPRKHVPHRYFWRSQATHHMLWDKKQRENKFLTHIMTYFLY